MARRRFESPEVGRGNGYVCDVELVRLFGLVERNDWKFAVACCDGDEIGAAQLTTVFSNDVPVKKVCVVWGKDWDSARINFLKKLGAKEELAALKARIARRDAQRIWWAKKRVANAKLGLNARGEPLPKKSAKKSAKNKTKKN